MKAKARKNRPAVLLPEGFAKLPALTTDDDLPGIENSIQSTGIGARTAALILRESGAQMLARFKLPENHDGLIAVLDVLTDGLDRARAMASLLETAQARAIACGGIIAPEALEL